MGVSIDVIRFAMGGPAGMGNTAIPFYGGIIHQGLEIRHFACFLQMGNLIIL